MLSEPRSEELRHVLARLSIYYIVHRSREYIPHKDESCTTGFPSCHEDALVIIPTMVFLLFQLALIGAGSIGVWNSPGLDCQ